MNTVTGPFNLVVIAQTKLRTEAIYPKLATSTVLSGYRRVYVDRKQSWLHISGDRYKLMYGGQRISRGTVISIQMPHDHADALGLHSNLDVTRVDPERLIEWFQSPLIQEKFPHPVEYESTPEPRSQRFWSSL